MTRPSSRSHRRRRGPLEPGRSQTLAEAFQAAAGPPVEPCPACGGAPCPPAVLAWVDASCPACWGPLWWPVGRHLSRRGRQPVKLINLAESPGEDA